MRNIQDVSSEILGGCPKSLYILLGTEYGIKEKYIETLYKHYGRKVEIDDMNAFVASLSVKQIFTIDPSVYVSRYDSEFLRGLTDKTAVNLNPAKINGTLVMIYDSESANSKCEKLFSDYSAIVPEVNTKFINKYIKSDFPALSDEGIHIATSIGNSYIHSKNIARCLLQLSGTQLLSHDKSFYSELFGVANNSSDKEIRIGVAARNFSYLLSVIENYGNELSYFLYSVLNTLIEIEKLLINKYAESDIRKYVNNWTLEDVYNMFNNVYSKLKFTRSISDISKDILVYCISLLQFNHIPIMEAS